jgi:peptide chain release factor
MNPYGVTEEKANALRARMEACGIEEADLDESFVRSGGPGGQHLNRVATCVVLKHAPSGQHVKMQQARSQGLNRYYARKRLCELLEGGTAEGRAAEKIRKQKARRKRRSRKKADESPGE